MVATQKHVRLAWLAALGILLLVGCDPLVGPIDSDNGGGTSSGYTLSIEVTGSGSVTRSPETASYADGEQVTLTAVPDLEWHFQGWGGDASNSSEEITITMTSDMSLTATFVEVVRDVRLSYSAISSSVDGSFSINYSFRNFGNTPVSIVAAAYVIYGSAGVPLSDIVKTTDTLTIPATLAIDEQINAQLAGYSDQYIPYYFRLGITIVDSEGTSQNLYYDHAFSVQ